MAIGNLIHDTTQIVSPDGNVLTLESDGSIPITISTSISGGGDVQSMSNLIHGTTQIIGSNGDALVLESDGSIPTTIKGTAEDIIAEENLMMDEEGTNDFVLTYDDTKIGSMTWAAVSGTVGSFSLVAELQHVIDTNYVKQTFIYNVDNDLERKDFKDVSDVVIYTKDFTWGIDGISNWTITRISDSDALTCTFVYTDGVLVRKDYS